MSKYIRTVHKPGRPGKLPPKIPFTHSAYKAMQDKRAELYQLKNEVIERLQEAREQGDLSENGAYKYAKFELGNIRRELRKLNHLIEDGEVRESNTSTGTISFGQTITVEVIDDGSGNTVDAEKKKKSITFMLVSEHESDPAEQKLSTGSPLGSAVNGKRVGDEIEVKTPRGIKLYKISKVENI